MLSAVKQKTEIEMW